MISKKFILELYYKYIQLKFKNKIMNTELKIPKYITLTERLNETYNNTETLENEQVNESLSSFSVQQKNAIRKIIKNRYDMLNNLSK